MDLALTETQQAFAEQARAWLADNAVHAPTVSFDTAEGFAAHRDWERRLFEGGWGVVPWPEAFGGRDADLIEWLLFEEEYYRAGCPYRLNQNGLFLLGPTLMEFGTPEQQQRFLPPMASGEHIWAQGWSEPDAGSDMAAIRTRAERDGDDWVITGQKTWSTRAAFADWMFALVRTDPDSRAPPRPVLRAAAAGRPGRGGPSHPPAQRRTRLRRGVPRPGPRPRRGQHRR